MKETFNSFREFYPFYLNEHRDRRCRLCHFVGSCCVLVTLVLGLGFNPWFFVGAPLVGYGFAWVGHFAFEKNRPATFSHPLYSFIGDWVMFGDMLTGRIKWR